MLTVLMKLDAQEKELWGNYNVVSTKYQDLAERHREAEEEVFALRESIFSLQKDNDFMKKLIFHANENYEALERKCQDL
jgi:chromosome segregation ATPase